ncbi:redox-regulated ATPase YchF [Candidatus Uhrbacteria bacterium]|nr:redox-regulated ATPase YchF [Candidatus Uhrbacteria bacterium]
MLKVGIVGLPNVGKSTLFKTLTKKQVPCENFPFCTIEPNVGTVEVPDDRLKQLAAVSKSGKIITAAIEFVDIAGLVKGASKGEGLGNKFLATIREVDMIAHVVRAFVDTNVHHVEGGVDILRDVEVIDIELAMADMVAVGKRLTAVHGVMKSGKTKELEEEEAFLLKVDAALSTGKSARSVIETEKEKEMIKPLQLLTAKPVIFVLNVSEDQLASPPTLLNDRELVVPLSIKIESEIVEMAPEDQKPILESLGITEPGLDRLIRESYRFLGLITYFTSGEMETRAWTIHRGTKAPQAAGVIHTDFEKGFIRAEVIDWKDFVALGEHGAKEAGKLRVEGKEYVMRDGDVCHFRIA